MTVSSRDNESQLVRFEALFSMVERLSQATSVEASAASIVQLKHIAQVSAWRLLLRRTQGYICVDGVRGHVDVVEQLELCDWDAQLWQMMRPHVLDPNSLTHRDGTPIHLMGKHVRQLFVMPTRRAGQPSSVIVVATRQPAFTVLDLKFLRMATSIICDHMAAIVMRNQIIRSLQEQAWRDGLTGLPNRNALTDTLHRALASAGRTGNPVTVLLSDIDRFKLINDTYGHAAGDDVLREVSRRMSGLTREGDLIGRYGGEEFLAVLHGCDESHGAALAERLRMGINQQPVELSSLDEKTEITVSMSIGVACTGTFPGRRASELVHLADEALYLAKSQGRNRVRIAQLSPDHPPQTPLGLENTDPNSERTINESLPSRAVRERRP